MAEDEYNCECLRQLALAVSELNWLSEGITWEVAGVGDLAEKLFPGQPPELIEKRQPEQRAKAFREQLEKAVQCGLDPKAPGGPIRGQDMVNIAKNLEDRLSRVRPSREDVMYTDYLTDALLDAVQLYCRR